ncbi:MAG: ferrous iron transport protein B [Candidatus Obscuribacterales bacterium]|nr:ferrous iron transport protein B [Candidatus Obscuribacterales bacterium]
MKSSVRVNKRHDKDHTSARGDGDKSGSAGLSIVLAGNPNVGKSVIFNALTGLSADVSNYPGTTIDIAQGRLGDDAIADTPGVYGISSLNDEERAARRMILEADRVINVVSALSLDRDLFLSLQLIDMGKPLIVVINQWDEALQRGIAIDKGLLSERLGVPVMHCVAVENKGISEIGELVKQARVGNIRAELIEKLQPVLDRDIDQSRALLILENDEKTIEECNHRADNLRTSIYSERRRLVDEVVDDCVSESSKTTKFSVKLGRFLLHPVYGGIIALLTCYFIFYQVLGVWIAGNLVDLTEKKTMRVYYEPVVRKLVAKFAPCEITINDKVFSFPGGTSSSADTAALEAAITSVSPDEVKYDFWKFRSNLLSIIGNVLVGEYGILTLTVTYLLGLLMPLVIGFYLGLSLLEDSGYLPRLAVLVDRLMNKIGLNGRAIIPLILGLGCVTMATITTRLLTTNREKLIATALLGIAIPCSAQLGVVSGTLARSGGGAAWAVYGGLVFGILAVSGLLLNKILPGKSQALLIDLPPMRLPRWDNVAKKTWKKSFAFLKESAPMFCLAGFVVTVAQMVGLLDWFVTSLQPLVVHWLKLPNDPRIPTTFILGIVRRDFAAFGLTEVALTAAQAVTAMIVITLFVPCIATVGVMIKERGPKVAFTIWIGSWLCAFLVGGILALLLPPLFGVLGVK